MVESQPSKLLVAGSIPVSRSKRSVILEACETMDEAGFQQAGIGIENQQAFEELRSRIDRALGPAAERFLKSLSARRIRIREFEALVAQGLLQAAVQEASQARDEELYRALALSDQGQMREYYLTAIEQVPDELRHKFHAVYRY